jgi:hypothetical protein
MGLQDRAALTMTVSVSLIALGSAVQGLPLPSMDTSNVHRHATGWGRIINLLAGQAPLVNSFVRHAEMV